MVSFSFESIARSASLDASTASPVSETARATHESFESHLQRAASTTVNQPARRPTQEDESREQSEPASNETARNEPVRQESGDSRREDDDVRVADDAEATTATETPRKRTVEDVEGDNVSEDEVAIHEVEPEVPGVSDDDPDRVVAAELLVAPIGDEESGHETPLEKDAEASANDEVVIESGEVVPAGGETKRVRSEHVEPTDSEPSTRRVENAEASADDEVIESGEVVPAGGETKRVRSEHVEPTDSEPSTRRVNPSETNEEVAAKELPEAAPVAETTTSDDEPPKTSTTQPRHGHRSDISPNLPTHEAPDAALKPVPVKIVETSADTASEDSSQERPHHREADSTQPIGKTAAADATTTTPGTPSRFAQHLVARIEDSHLNITNADQARFVDRVARAVQATGDRGGTLRLRLSPPELGAMTLEVKVQGGVVSARVEADTPAARSLLIENLPLLRERLAEYGMRVDQFDVDLTDRHPRGTPDGLQQNDQQQESPAKEKTTLHDAEDTPQAVTSDKPTNNGNEQLNIIV